MSGWIGVDLDGTLAVYRGWNGGQIGEPVPAMVDRVKAWLAEGQEVRVLTARVAASGQTNGSGVLDSSDFAEEQRRLIQAWCLEHVGVALQVTATKDLGMTELWDDRAVRVESNTGMDDREKSDAIIVGLQHEIRALQHDLGAARNHARILGQKISDAKRALT